MRMRRARSMRRAFPERGCRLLVVSRLVEPPGLRWAWSRHLLPEHRQEAPRDQLRFLAAGDDFEGTVLRAIGFTTAFFVVERTAGLVERTAGFVDVFAFTVGRFAAGALFAVESLGVTFAFEVERFTGAAERRALD